MGAASVPPAAAAPPEAPIGAGRGACGVVVAAVGAAAAAVAADAAFDFPVAARIALWAGWIGLVLGLARARRPRAVPWSAGVVVVLAAAAAVALDPRAVLHVRRLGTPWHRPAAPAGFRLKVVSDEPVIRRGGPITLSALAEPLGPDAVLPDAAVVVFRNLPDGRPVPAPMAADGAGGFHFTRPVVPSDFAYRVEAGAAVSPWHTVRVGDPVELADGTGVTVTLPAYTGRTPPATADGLQAIEGLQHAIATVRLVFTQPVGTAFVRWQPAAGPAADPDRPVVLAADRQSGTATVRLTGDGVLRVVVVNEPFARRLKSEFVVPVRGVPDAPPRFESVTGITPRPVTLPPGGRVEVAFTAADDVGLAGAWLEYIPAGGEPRREPVPLVGGRGRVVLPLAGTGGEGETVRFRLRIADGRQVPDANLGPQETFYPPSGWAEVRLTADAPPADGQEAFALRDAIRADLDAAITEVKAARDEVAALGASDERSAWPVDHAVRLDQARAGVRGAADRLDAAAVEAALRPPLRPLARQLRGQSDRLRATAAGPLAEAPADRRAALAAGAGQLAEAVDRLNALIAVNDRLARDGLDYRRLERLAAEADRPGAADRLRAVIADSPAFQRAVAASARRDSGRLAAEVDALAERVGDLDSAAARLAAGVRRGVLARLAREQRQTAARAAGDLARVDTAARLARVALPSAGEFRRAAGLIADDRLVDALVELEGLALALDRAAGAFDAAADRDPKAAARRLAGWQDDLSARFAAATKAVPFAGLPDGVKERFRAEQRAALAAVLDLHLPPTAEVVSLRDAVLPHLRLAEQRLSGDGVGAAAPLRLAGQRLGAFADKMSTAADRLRLTRPKLDPLRARVDDVAVATDKLVRLQDGAPPNGRLQRYLAGKLRPELAKQQEVADGLDALDLPGLDARQARAVAAARAAAADLAAGLPLDAPASLAWSLREIDRLRQALDGTPAADEFADQLVRLQRGVTALPGQSEVTRRLAGLTAPEAPGLLASAQEAVRRAEAGYRDQLKAEILRSRTLAAAEALARLADRLNARESDRDRLERLARNRRAAAEAARKLQGQPFLAEAANAAKRELADDAVELTHTRVGPDGQPLKRRALDAFARLRDKPEPHKDPGGQAALADLLDGLAEAAAEVPELTAAPGRIWGPPEPDPADAFVPSTRLAALLRDLAKQVRGVREQANAAGEETARRLRPAADNPLTEVIHRQQAVVAAAEALARSHPGRPEPFAAAWACRSVPPLLETGRVGPAKAAAERAAGRLQTVEGAAELAGRQRAIGVELGGWVDRPDLAAAQQVARQAALAKEAAALADRFAGLADDDTIGTAVAGAAKSVRAAGRMLGEGQPRASVEQLLRQVAEGMDSGEAGHEEPDAATVAVGDALRTAAQLLRIPGDRAKIVGRVREAIGRAVTELAR